MINWINFVLVLSREILRYVNQRGCVASDSVITGVTGCWPQKCETIMWTDSGYRSTVFKSIKIFQNKCYFNRNIKTINKLFLLNEKYNWNWNSETQDIQD